MNKFYILRPIMSPSLYGGPSQRAHYLLNHTCKKCGTGAVPTGPCIVSDLEEAIEMNQRILLTFHNEILIDMDLSAQLQAKGIGGLADVFDNDLKKLPYMQLRAEGILPPFSSESSGFEIEGQCSECNRDGYFNIPKVPLDLIYQQIKPELVKKNILATFEGFGNSVLRNPLEDSHFASPILIISEPLANIFLDEDIEEVKCDEPIKIITYND